MSARTALGTTKFGWCIDGFHARCWAANQGLVCACKCHKGGAE